MNAFGMKCPKCGDEDHIDIYAIVCVRLTASGTDTDEANNSDHEWTSESDASCTACGHDGTVKEFTTEQTEEDVTLDETTVVG